MGVGEVGARHQLREAISKTGDLSKAGGDILFLVAQILIELVDTHTG